MAKKEYLSIYPLYKRIVTKINSCLSFLGKNDWIIILIFFFSILGAIVSDNPIRKGDGTEYMIATETLFFDHNLEYSENVFKRHLALKPASLDGVGGVFNIGKNDQQYLTQHPFYYSLFSVPVYGLLELINTKLAYWSFAITNLLFLSAVLVALIYYLKTKIKTKLYLLISISLILFSTVLPYVFWQHPEIFIFSLIFFFFFCLFALNKPMLSSVFLGLAVGQSLVLFPYLLILLFEIYLKKNKRILAVLPIYIRVIIIFSLFGSLHYIISHLLTGHLFPLENYATFSLLAIKDVVRALIDPAVGLIWFYPMTIFCLLFAKNNSRTYVVIFAAILSLTLYMVNNQFYTHQVGLRYLNYIYPSFFFIIDPKKIKIPNISIIIIICFAAFLTIPISLNMHLSNDEMYIGQKNFIAYKAILRLFPFAYKDHPGVFVYRSQSLTDLSKESERVADKLKIFVQNTKLFSDGWISGNSWTRVLLNPVNLGNLTLEFREKDKSVVAIVNNHKYFSSEGKLSIDLRKEDILHSTKRDKFTVFSNYVYLDLYLEGWCPCDKGLNDQRLLGNYIEGIINNERVLYQYKID